MRIKVSFISLMLLTAAACGGRTEPAPAVKPAVDVRVARTAVMPTAVWYEAGGVVQAQTSATLTSRILAPVMAVRVRPGDRVRAGQLLIQLDDRGQAANARRASAALDAAESAARSAASERDAAEAAGVLADTTWRRISRLQERKSASQQELDEATAAARAATARAASARAQIAQADATVASARAASEAAVVMSSYARITAPFDGRVTEKLIEPGNMAAPGTPLLRLESTDGYRVDVRLDEARAASISPGQSLTVLLDDSRNAADSRTLQGTVTELARAIDADARTFLVKVRIAAGSGSGGQLRPGMFARIRVPGPPRDTLRVPASAIVRHGQVATVFIVERERARVRLVQTGSTDGKHVEILSGLDAGELVVMSPPPALVDRAAVRVTPVDAQAAAAPVSQEASR